MAHRERPTRAEIRDRNARTPSARVYVLVISDPRADDWRSNLAVYADTPQDAEEHWRRLGVVRDYETLRHDKTDNDDFAIAMSRPGVVFLRRATHPGDEPWMALPEGYQWPHETAALSSRDGLLPQELDRWPPAERIRHGACVRSGDWANQPSTGSSGAATSQS